MSNNRRRSNSQSSIKSTSSQKRSIDLNKINVYLEYPCFICGLVLDNATTSIEHTKSMHSYDIPSRPKNQIKRPRHHRFYYVQDKNGEFTLTENACPSCWFHCPENDLDCLNQHIRESHNPKKLQGKEKGVEFKTESNDIVKQENNDIKLVKFENDDSTINKEDGFTTDKIKKIDDTVMAELVKAFERFAQSLKIYSAPSND